MPNIPLVKLLQRTSHRQLAGNAGAVISQITQDSRLAAPCACFVAVPGFSVDGHQFIPAALAAGAAAVVVQADRREQWQPLLEQAASGGAAVVEVEDSRAVLADLAAALYDQPGQRLTMIGVTGTDGKTTTSYLIHALLNAAGHFCGLISGVEFEVGGERRANETGETTPEADVIQPLLAEMQAAGQTHAVIECSSHALVLQRLRGCEFDLAVFTGFSDDHLDFHQTRERYLEAKLSLFRSLDAPQRPDSLGPRFAVVRAADPLHGQIAAAHGQTTLTTSNGETGADVSVLPLSQDATGAVVRVVVPAGALAARLRMPGAYNLANASLAVGAAWALGARPVQLQRGFESARSVPGRMESIDLGQPFPVIVDAAATGPALRVALGALRPHVEGRLIVVFGVAGERDLSRRRAMGKAAAELADRAVLTSENPRSEDPAAIVAAITAAMREAGADDRIVEEPDRRAAIRLAFAGAQPSDLVLIAGKGAESSLIFADHSIPWDDRTVAREELRRLLG